MKERESREREDGGGLSRGADGGWEKVVGGSKARARNNNLI